MQLQDYKPLVIFDWQDFLKSDQNTYRPLDLESCGIKGLWRNFYYLCPLKPNKWGGLPAGLVASPGWVGYAEPGLAGGTKVLKGLWDFRTLKLKDFGVKRL